LNNGDGRAIAPSHTLLDNPEVSPLSVKKSILGLIKQLVDDRWFFHVRKGLTSSMEIPPLGEGNHFFGQRANHLGLRIGCFNLFMSEQGGHHIPEHRTPMTRIAS